MRTLVIGDVHGCSRELARLVKQAEPDRVVLLGDLFTKGPDPVGVYAQIVDGGYAAVLGNHDDRLLRGGAKHVARKLDAGAPTWRAWLEGLPLFRDEAGWTVVHAGLHPSGDLDRTDRFTALYRRRWPRDKPGEPLWHSLYEGERRVVFGHDAVRGLIRYEREGRPWIMGLDTGCVYGGRLTGYVLETDEILQVRAKKVYHRP